eukprot:SAG31_NODE_225_length_19846_cov_19.057983_17_plen_187_part_00
MKAQALKKEKRKKKKKIRYPKNYNPDKCAPNDTVSTLSCLCNFQRSVSAILRSAATLFLYSSCTCVLDLVRHRIQSAGYRNGRGRMRRRRDGSEMPRSSQVARVVFRHVSKRCWIGLINLTKRAPLWMPLLGQRDRRASNRNLSWSMSLTLHLSQPHHLPQPYKEVVAAARSPARRKRRGEGWSRQ